MSDQPEGGPVEGPPSLNFETDVMPNTDMSDKPQWMQDVNTHASAHRRVHRLLGTPCPQDSNLRTYVACIESDVAYAALDHDHPGFTEMPWRRDFDLVRPLRETEGVYMTERKPWPPERSDDEPEEG